MRAISVSAWTAPADLAVSEVEAPPCGPGEVRIRVRAAPVSFALSLLVAGKYQRKPAFPFVPGNTAAGIVIETGRDARRCKPGDRVLASLDMGEHAEEAVAHQANAYTIPESLSFERAVALNTAYNSVAAALTWPHLLALTADDTLLVHGGAGGTGSAAIEIARHLGARVIATATSEEKRVFARKRGADEVLGAEPEMLKERVMALTGGRGVSRVLDPVGGRLFTESLRCLAPEGRIVPLGFAGGEVPQVPANLLLVKNIAVCGLYMGYYKIDERDRFEPRMRTLFDQLGRWCEVRIIDPFVSATFSLENTSDAFERVLDRSNIGHVVVVFE